MTSPTLVTLEEFREFLDWNPFHFWGLSDQEALRVTSACDPRVFQFSYQSPGSRLLGRTEILRAISSAEEKLEDYLGFSVAPRYREVTLPWPRLRDRRLRPHGSVGVDGRWRSLQLPEGYVQAVGQETFTPVVEGVSIYWEDQDGDGYLDTGVVGPITTSVSPSELCIVFSESERYDSSQPLKMWEIRPKTVHSSGNGVIISFRRWLAVKPRRYQGVLPPSLDPGDPSIFPVTVDVYRRWIDPDRQGTVFWDSRPAPGSDPVGVFAEQIRVGIHDPVDGVVTVAPARYDAESSRWASLLGKPEPDRVFIRYLAGFPRDSHGRVASSLREAVILLAIAEMARPICGCDEANRILYHWQFDLARTTGADAQFATSTKTLQNPFGTRRGHVAAWEKVESLRRTSSILV